MKKYEKYKYGDPIPKEYRDRLYDWDGGGYSGCIWEKNQGVVDGQGNWRPIYSTGIDGLDKSAQYDQDLKEIKNKFGYGAGNVDAQHIQREHDAVEQVFGEKWWNVPPRKDEDGFDSYIKDPRVQALLEKDNENYKAYKAELEKLNDEYKNKLNALFMDVVTGAIERPNFQEIGQIDAANIKTTCKDFCRTYSGNVGMMVNVLDGLADLGYSPWCTCTDCGDQFQLCGYESFSELVDCNSYRGDGGIGTIMDRIMCEECHTVTECNSCWEYNKPNQNATSSETWSNYDTLACIFLDWIDVCYSCTERFECRHLKTWDGVNAKFINSSLGEKYYAIENALIEDHGCEGQFLYDELKKTVDGRKKINEIRDLLAESAGEFFKHSVSEDLFSDRLSCKNVWVLKAKCELIADAAGDDDLYGEYQSTFTNEEQALDELRNFLRPLVNDAHTETHWDESEEDVDKVIDSIIESGSKKRWSYEGSKQSFVVTLTEDFSAD